MRGGGGIYIEVCGFYRALLDSRCLDGRSECSFRR